MSNIIFLIV